MTTPEAAREASPGQITPMSPAGAAPMGRGLREWGRRGHPEPCEGLGGSIPTEFTAVLECGLFTYYFRRFLPVAMLFAMGLLAGGRLVCKGDSAGSTCHVRLARLLCFSVLNHNLSLKIQMQRSFVQTLK